MIRQLRIKDRILFSSDRDHPTLIDPILQTELNSSGSLTFSITKENPFYDKLEKLTTYIDYYEDDDWVWGGRVVDSDDDYDNVKSIYCEGYLSFLVDTQFEPFLHQGSIKELFDKIVNSHNSQVEPTKRFIIGTVSVVDNNNYIRRESESYITSMEALKTRLVDTHKGYLNVRKVGDSLYLDYLSGFGRVASQEIAFGKNLLDLNKHISSKSICSVIIPLGAEIDDGSDKPKRVDIKSVNNDTLFIESSAAIEKYGRITGIVYFDDVTLPVNLLAKAKEYLNEISSIGESIELSAVDLSTIHVDIESFRLGDWINIVSDPHNLSSKMMLSRSSKTLNDASKDTIILGTVLKSYTSTQSKESIDITKRIEQTNNTQYQFINDAIKNTTDLITGGKGGFVVWGFNEQGQPEELFFLDTPEVATARTVLRLNKNGIAGSTSGIKGPYNVGMLLDGSINASRITSGEISAVDINGVNIKGSNIKGGTIDVDTDIKVGRNIKLNPEAQSGANKGSGIIFHEGTCRIIYGSTDFDDSLIAYINNGYNGARLVLKDNIRNVNMHAEASINYGNATISVGDGTAKMQSALNGPSIQMYNDKIYASRPITVTSDEKSKENIIDIELSSLVDLLKIKEFNYINQENKMVGIIAQQLEGTKFENLVLSKADDGIFTVDYNAINMAVLQKTQEQEKRIKKLEEVLGIVNYNNERKD